LGVVDAGESRAIGVLAVAFACLLLQNQLIHEAADRGEDRAGGVHTTVMLLGREGSAMAAAALGLLAVLAAWRAGMSPWLPALVYVAGFPVVLARSGDDERRMAQVRMAHRALSIVFGAALFAVR
jgi:4-hydroxybenzoate polyprenyltransferase